MMHFLSFPFLFLGRKGNQPKNCQTRNKSVESTSVLSDKATRQIHVLHHTDKGHKHIDIYTHKLRYNPQNMLGNNLNLVTQEACEAPLINRSKDGDII